MLLIFAHIQGVLYKGHYIWIYILLFFIISGVIYWGIEKFKENRKKPKKPKDMMSLASDIIKNIGKE